MKRIIPAILLVLLIPWTSWAAKPTIQVLTLEAQEGLEKYSGRLAKPFVQAAKAELKKYFKVTSHDIVEMELNVCEQPNNKACFRTLYAKSSKDALLLGKVVSKQGSSSKLTVILYYFSRTYRSEPRNVTLVVPRNIPASKVKALFRQKIRDLIKGEKGRLEIVVPVSGVKIEIDGTVIAASAQKGTIPATLPPGPHKIVASKGDKRVVRTVDVSIFTSAAVKFSKKELLPTPAAVPAKTPAPAAKTKPAPEQASAPAQQPPQQTATAATETKSPSEPKPAEQPTWWQKQNKWKVAFWSSAALTVVLFGTGIYTGMRVRELEDEKEDFMRASPHSSEYVGVDDVCSMEIPEGDEHLKEICDDGQQMALTTNILMFTGVLTGLATGYFMHKAYIDTSDGVKTDSDIAPEGGASMSIAPYFGTHSGGISLKLSY